MSYFSSFFQNGPNNLILTFIQRVITLVAITLLSACSSDDSGITSPGMSPLVTYDASVATYQTLDGTGLELNSFSDHKIFINYWATWCAPCIRELPALSRTAAILQDEGYIFLFASDEKIETIEKFMKTRGFDQDFAGNFVKLNGYFGMHGIDAVPSSTLYAENSILLQSWAGEREWDSPEVIAEIRALTQ